MIKRALITLMVMLAVPAIVSSHRFLKKTSGLPEKMNEFAAQGCRFTTGRRVGLIDLFYSSGPKIIFEK